MNETGFDRNITITITTFNYYSPGAKDKKKDFHLTY